MKLTLPKFPLPVSKAVLVHDALVFVVTFVSTLGASLADSPQAAGWDVLASLAVSAAVTAAKTVVRQLLPGVTPKA